MIIWRGSNDSINDVMNIMLIEIMRVLEEFGVVDKEGWRRFDDLRGLLIEIIIYVISLIVRWVLNILLSNLIFWNL